MSKKKIPLLRKVYSAGDSPDEKNEVIHFLPGPEYPVFCLTSGKSVVGAYPSALDLVTCKKCRAHIDKVRLFTSVAATIKAQEPDMHINMSFLLADMAMRGDKKGMFGNGL